MSFKEQQILLAIVFYTNLQFHWIGPSWVMCLKRKTVLLFT